MADAAAPSVPSTASADYRDCLEDCRRHHASSKTFSGRFLRPHTPFIKEIIDRLGCRSVLDYGCGKGEQYAWVMPSRGITIEEFWGVPVTKYDPAWPPFAAEPEGSFDLVICTHTLGAIPAGDVPWVVDRLISLSAKAVYIAEKLGPVKKKVFTRDVAMARWNAEGWKAAVWRETDRELTLSLHERRGGDEGTVIEHWRNAVGGWQRVVWPESVRALSHRTA